MRFFLAAKRTFCVITLYALEIKALFFKARFVANLDDYKCVACCKRVYSCGETIKKHEVSFFLSDTVNQLEFSVKDFTRCVGPEISRLAH